MREDDRVAIGKGLRAMCSAGLDAPMLAIVEVWSRGVVIRTFIH
jgi:6-phosphogluconate dehydrogenase (decarboxylating)